MNGLSSKCDIVDGKFSLTKGGDKVQDAIWFYCVFDKFRIYTSDFGGNFKTLIQRPISQIVLNKTILLGNLKKGIQKFVPNVRVNNVDVGYIGTDRTNYTLAIEYSATIENNVEINEVTFV